MAIKPPLCPPVAQAGLRTAAAVRVLYADTDKMGIAYHASYLRYLELARVELIRGQGVPYTEFEDVGLALPLTDIAIKYRAPALYDDRMSLDIGLSLVTQVRVNFEYRVWVRAGDRRGLETDLEILTAHTRHACVRKETGRPDRLPGPVYEALRACMTPL